MSTLMIMIMMHFCEVTFKNILVQILTQDVLSLYNRIHVINCMQQYRIDIC